jgi:predicted HTH transcriptional regulator
MWTLQRIQELLANQEEEHLHLEYKAADAFGKSDGKKAEIWKDVSAFPNSDGGMSIYGMRENAQHRLSRFDPINASDFTKECLKQVINFKIDPRNHGSPSLQYSSPPRANDVV